MREKIQDHDWLYTFLKYFVDWSVRSSYRRYQVEGTENIPTDGSVIWAAEGVGQEGVVIPACDAYLPYKGRH